MSETKIKAMDLANLMRDAFLQGRGLKDGDKLSQEDADAWMNYVPTNVGAYDRVAALIEEAIRFRSAPWSHGRED